MQNVTSSRQARDRLRATSKSIFGNKYFLEVALEISRAEDGRVYAREVADRMNVPDASLRGPLNRLISGGYLRALGDARGSLPKLLERRDSALWDLVEAVAAEVQAETS